MEKFKSLFFVCYFVLSLVLCLRLYMDLREANARIVILEEKNKKLIEHINFLQTEIDTREDEISYWGRMYQSCKDGVKNPE